VSDFRDLTKSERESLREGRCPFCKGQSFLRGPSGGLSTNWYCANERCRAGFNIASVTVGATSGVLIAQLIQEPLAKVLPA